MLSVLLWVGLMALILIGVPIAFSMFLTCRICKVSTGAFIREIMPFLACLFVALMLVTYVPAISTWLPNLLMGK